jgi:NAD(P)H-dependent flavin oxidoreductase YrpB (nitropropane dioxygenase family)
MVEQQARGSEQRPDEPVIGETTFGGQRLTMRRFMGFPPRADATGEIESMPLLAGRSAGLVNEIKPAGEIVEELMEGARRIIESF